MTFKNYTPWKTNPLPPFPQRTTENIVQIPNGKSAKEHAQAKNHHEPHCFQRLHVAHVLKLLSLLAGDWEPLLFTSESVLFTRLAPSRTERDFHSIHASEDDDGSQKRVGILVEDGVLQVMIIQRNEDGEACEEDSEELSNC